MNNKEIGQIGEDLAVKYLRKHRYRIIARNYSSKLGEIDIIALYRGVVAFVEVKYRSDADFALPSQAVNYDKQRHIIKTAKHYMLSAEMGDYQPRFDIIEVYSNKRVNHIMDAFRAN